MSHGGEKWLFKTTTAYFIPPIPAETVMLLNWNCSAAIQAFSSSADPEMKTITKEEPLVPPGGLSAGHYDTH